MFYVVPSSCVSFRGLSLAPNHIICFQASHCSPQGGVADWMRGSSPHAVPDRPRVEPSKTRRCFRLDTRIVPTFCSGSSPRRALKTRRCSGLTLGSSPCFAPDCPRVELKKQGGVPDWMRGSSPHCVPDCPCIEPSKQGGVPTRTKFDFF